MTDESPTTLDGTVDPDAELGEHPEEVTEDEAAAGHEIWQAVDDLDDHSHGLDDHPHVSAVRPETSGSALRLAQYIRTVMLAHGVPEVSIELMAGRPVSGDAWTACKPVAAISHHIASHPTPAKPTPGLALVKRGRPDLAGPLANGSAGVDLVYRIITLGLANHPGVGGPWTVRGPLGAYVVPKDVARPYVWGTEYEGGYDTATWDRVYTNKRTGKSMTFREFMGRANAALVEAIWHLNGHGKTPKPGMDLSGYHGEHKTWAPGRKTDRLNYTTDSGRAEIRRYTNQEDDVSAKDVWDHPLTILTGNPGDTRKAGTVLVQSHKRALDARTTAAAALAQAKANAAAISALAAHIGGPHVGEVQALLNVPEPVIAAEPEGDVPDAGADLGAGPDPAQTGQPASDAANHPASSTEV